MHKRTSSNNSSYSVHHLKLTPTLSNTSNISDYSVSSVGTRRANYTFSTQLFSNESWIKINIDSIHFDLRNDEYEIKLSNTQIMSFDFNSRTCSLRVPSNKVQIDTTLNEEIETENYDGTPSDIEQLLEEIDHQTTGLHIANIKKEWRQLQQSLSSHSLNVTPKTSNIKQKPCCYSIEQCPHIQQIVFVLRIYSAYLDYKTKQQLYNVQTLPESMSQIIDSLEKYDKIKLLNDYLHIKQQHYNNNEFHELRSYIKTKLPACDDLKTCICCNRNKEPNQIYKNLQSKTRRDLYLINHSFTDCSIEEMHEINLQKYIDIIHSTLVHQMASDYANYKFTTHLLDSNEDEKNNTNILHSAGDAYDEKARVNIADVLHKCGHKFSYWNEKLPDYIAPKHADLKTELLCQNMTNNDYKILQQRANDFLQCESGQNMICRRQFSIMHKGVKLGQHISVDHIISMMLYTNYIGLRDQLISLGFTRTDEQESIHDLKKRHSQIVHFARLLKEMVFCFGDNMSDRSKLYHGFDCRLMLNQVYFSLHMPISATVKYSIAPITANNGICFKFGKPLSANLKNYCFDVSDISQFPEEKERVIFGGEAFGVLDIIYNGHSHSEQVMSLRLFHQIIKGNWFTNNKELMKTKHQRRLIIIINLMRNSHANSSKKQNYIMELFKHILLYQLKDNNNTLWVNGEEMELCLYELRKLFLDKFQGYLIKTYSNLSVKQNDILEMSIPKSQIEQSSFKNSLYSNLYTYRLNDKGEKVSFVFRCFQKYDEQRKENMFRGFIAIKYLPKNNDIKAIEMRYGLHFPQKIKFSKWDKCVLSSTVLYKGSSLFALSDIKSIDILNIKICFQITKVQ